MLPEMWISTRAILLDKMNGPKNERRIANKEVPDYGLIPNIGSSEPKSSNYFPYYLQLYQRNLEHQGMYIV